MTSMKDDPVLHCEVYVGLSLDVLHHGHTRLLKEASKLGLVTVGLLTDSAIRSHKSIPALTFEQRAEILRSLETVGHVVPQSEWDYSPNIRRYRPRYFVHGDDWIDGSDRDLRKFAIEALAEVGGELVEIPSTVDISTLRLSDSYDALKRNDKVRLSALRRLLEDGGFVRVIESHSPLSATLVQNTRVSVEGRDLSFDALWSSSLTDATLAGKPDNEELTLSERIRAIDSILEATTLPIIVDGETGGQVPHLLAHCRTMIRKGISAIVIEDKAGLKQNSLLGSSNHQFQETVENFAFKIEELKRGVLNSDFMIIARIESLIMDMGMEDALSRARAYSKAGADGLLIHSKSQTPAEVLEFARRLRQEGNSLPLVCVPTTYCSVSESQLRDSGFQMVIYANHLLRSCIPAMQQCIRSILERGSGDEVNDSLCSIDDLLGIFPG